MGFNGDSMGFNGIGDGMPSGNLLQFAIENGPVEIVDLPIINGGSFHSYVSLPEGSNQFEAVHPGSNLIDLFSLFEIIHA